MEDNLWAVAHFLRKQQVEVAEDVWYQIYRARAEGQKHFL